MPLHQFAPLLRSLSYAPFVIVMGLGGCDPEPDTSPRGASSPDLSQFGVDEVRSAPEQDGVFELLDGDGEGLGRVMLEVSDEGEAVDIELDGVHSRIEWNDGGVDVQCSSEPAEPSDACIDAALAASLLAESRGVDVPGYEAAPDLVDPPAATAACETISTFSTSCQACETKAATLSQYSEHNGGGCSMGWIWATCWHRYCSSDGFEIELGGES